MFNVQDFFTLEYMLVLMAGVILYLLYYVYTKDAEYNKNIHSVASVVEELNREIFYLKKSIDDVKKSVQLNTRGMSDTEIYTEIERTVYDMVHPLSQHIKELQHEMNAIDSQIESRVASIEYGVKHMSLPTSVYGNDDEKIISLYKQGITLETISKELNISQPEVEFVLKINKLK
jgi:hypothetical protein